MGGDVSPRIGRRIGRNSLGGLGGKCFDEEDALLGGRVVAEEFLQAREECLEGGDVVGFDAEAVDVLVLVLGAGGGCGAEEGFLVDFVPGDCGD